VKFLQGHRDPVDGGVHGGLSHRSARLFLSALLGYRAELPVNYVQKLLADNVVVEFAEHETIELDSDLIPLRGEVWRVVAAPPNEAPAQAGHRSCEPIELLAVPACLVLELALMGSLQDKRPGSEKPPPKAPHAFTALRPLSRQQTQSDNAWRFAM